MLNLYKLWRYRWFQAAWRWLFVSTWERWQFMPGAVEHMEPDDLIAVAQTRLKVAAINLFSPLIGDLTVHVAWLGARCGRFSELHFEYPGGRAGQGTPGGSVPTRKRKNPLEGYPMTEKSTTISSRLSLFELANEQLTAIVAGDVARAHECERAAKPWELHGYQLQVERDEIGVMVSAPEPSAAAPVAGEGERFVQLDPLTALELCGADRVTPDAAQRAIDALDRLGAWDRLAAVFEWLSEPRTERFASLDDRPPEEIVALAAGSFEHWQPYCAPRRADDETFVRYRDAVAEANAAWLTEQQEQARQAIATATVEREKQALRAEVRDEIRAEVVRDHWSKKPRQERSSDILRAAPGPPGRLVGSQRVRRRSADPDAEHAQGPYRRRSRAGSGQRRRQHQRARGARRAFAATAPRHVGAGRRATGRRRA